MLINPIKPKQIDAAPRVETTPVQFDAEGFELSGVLYKPKGRIRAALVLNGATGVPQSFYSAFARWLAETRNLAVLTFDYRDFGASRSRPLRRSDATMASWALVDQPAARRAVRDLLPGVALWVLGHSLGAMMLPMQKGIADIERVIAVTSGFVHHSDHPWPYQGAARLFWFCTGPVTTGLAGYLPGRLSGFGQDLPAGVFWQWRRWCTQRAFFFDEIMQGELPEPAWAQSGAPLRVVALADDDMMPLEKTARLPEIYAHAKVNTVVLDPASYGLGKVGHLGVFSRRNAAMWPDVIG